MEVWTRLEEFAREDKVKRTRAGNAYVQLRWIVLLGWSDTETPSRGVLSRPVPGRNE